MSNYFDCERKVYPLLDGEYTANEDEIKELLVLVLSRLGLTAETTPRGDYSDREVVLVSL